MPFLAVVEHGSFRAAANALGVTPSAVSQAVSNLEGRLGVPLLARTTRSVGLTQAGEVMVQRCRPAMAEIGDAFDSVRAFGERPSGLLRLNAPRIAKTVVFDKVLPGFLTAYPDVEVEVFYDDGLADIVSEGFDAGLRLGQMVAPDMVSRALTPLSQMAVVASHAYLSRKGVPKTPDELSEHQCINFRRPTQRTIYHWRFVVDGSDVHVPVSGNLIFNESESKIAAAREGLGLAYEIKPVVQDDLVSGALVSVLDDYLPTIPGFHIYFPSRAKVMLKLRVFIEYAAARLS